MLRTCLTRWLVLAMLSTPAALSAQTMPEGFQEFVILSGLVQPTAVRFAPDGRIFVAEKRGVIKVFDNLADTTPTVFADLNAQVYNFWDRGLLALALHPQFPAVPYVFVLYTHDFDPRQPELVPRWGTPGVYGDPCPTPPGPTADGCVVSGRLSRLEASGNVMTGAEQVLIDDWCQQFPSHSIGSLVFGADGALYVSGGEGADFNSVDYGQNGIPRNPCGDPPVAVGGTQSPPAAEGGALRSQDLRTSGDPVTLDGTIIRVDPNTGAARPDNPLAASADPNARRIIAYGLRNPFRLAMRPGTNDLWIADVGSDTYEEINRIPNPTASPVRNFGWPCYEGVERHGGYDAENLTICETLYGETNAMAPPVFAYHHIDQVIAGESCPSGSSSISGVAFYGGGNYPSAYAGALFFSDYSRDCIWVMFRGANGLPDPAQRATFVAGAANPVDLQIGPNGDLVYVDHNDGTVRRIRFFPANQPPTAVLHADRTSGHAPLQVTFDGSGSTDPDAGDQLTYAWDLDGDGQFDDANGACCPVRTYAPGDHVVSLRVTDTQDATSVATVTIASANTPPSATIVAPLPTLQARIGDLIAFSAEAADQQDGTLPPAAFAWTLVIQHCPSNCHQHIVQTFDGVSGGSFNAMTHEYPSHIELRLTVVDSGGLEAQASVSLPAFIVPTTTTLTSSPNPSLIAQAMTLAAHVAPAAATGTVRFARDGIPIPGCEAQPLAVNGSATCATTSAVAGAFAFSAAFSGTEPYEGSASAPVLHVVNRLSSETMVAIETNPVKEGRAVTVTATAAPDGATGTMTLLMDGTTVGVATMAESRAAFTLTEVPAGARDLVARYSGDAMFVASESPPVTLTILPVYRQYFAEGATGFFQTDIGLLNASRTLPADVTVTLLPELGPPRVLPFLLAPLGRRTIDLDTALGSAQGVSTLVESDQPIAAMRQVTWGAPVYGSTLESGIPRASTLWYFAEGATSAFSLFYLIENPGGAPARVTLTHLLEGGAPPLTQPLDVPPFARRTVFVNELPGAEAAALSTIVSSDRPVVAERAMYLPSAARLWEGGATGRGATTLSETWNFAEGATGFFHTYLTLGNPDAATASVSVRYQWPDGSTLTKAYDVTGRSRRTIDVNGEDARLAAATVALSVSSTIPIVAERVMWWGDPWIEGSVALGSTETGVEWAIGEAAEGGPSADATFVVVSNASSDAGVARVTVVYDDGVVEERRYELPGTSRLTVRVADDFPHADGRRFSVLVESLTGAPIAVEVARYQSPDAFGRAGGAASATRIR